MGKTEINSECIREQRVMVGGSKKRTTRDSISCREFIYFNENSFSSKHYTQIQLYC